MSTFGPVLTAIATPFDDDGNVDEDAIEEAIEELLRREPYLAARESDGGSSRPRGSADGGTRSGKETYEPKPGTDRLAHADRREERKKSKSRR